MEREGEREGVCVCVCVCACVCVCVCVFPICSKGGVVGVEQEENQGKECEEANNTWVHQYVRALCIKHFLSVAID